MAVLRRPMDQTRCPQLAYGVRGITQLQNLRDGVELYALIFAQLGKT